jgi:hypothetical protein
LKHEASAAALLNSFEYFFDGERTSSLVQKRENAVCELVERNAGFFGGREKKLRGYCW